YKPSQRGETTPVRPQHQFDEDRLKEYLSAKSFVSNDDTLVVRQYSAGQSNPTFLIQTPSKSYVLRKKPPGALLPGAHKVDREYRVQKALHSSGFPVPRPLLHCTDIDVIGTEFYLMEHIVQGRIFWDLRLPGVIPAERAALYVAAVEVLAKLHSLDLASLKLDGYGKGIGYCRRQVSTWTKQYTASSHRDIPAMNELSAWLMTGIPTVDDLISVYRRCRGIPSTLPSLNFYLALSLFKMAGIAQGVHARHLLGNASAPNAAELGQCVEPLAVLALQLAQGVVKSVFPPPNEVPAFILSCLSFSFVLFFLSVKGVHARHLLGNASESSRSRIMEPLPAGGERPNSVGLCLHRRGDRTLPLCSGSL
uniref:Aminoglycoside phosphotransferase domain-containing protein n=1 Tax=Hippocampus comes TaxID=109280 RepID=A0A3Q2YWT7_HIPCM